MRKDKTGDTAQIQTRSEDTTATPSGIRGAGSEYLRKQDQGQEDQDPEIRIVQIVKQTLVHDMRELPVQQRADRIIASPYSGGNKNIKILSITPPNMNFFQYVPNFRYIPSTLFITRVK